MTTITLTKANYFEFISKVNALLFTKKKVKVSLDIESDIQTIQDEADRDYNNGKTINMNIDDIDNTRMFSSFVAKHAK